jgi:hypothetical protein
MNAHKEAWHFSSTANFFDDSAENFALQTGHGICARVGNFDAHSFKHFLQNECLRHPAKTGLSFGCACVHILFIYLLRERKDREHQRKVNSFARAIKLKNIGNNNNDDDNEQNLSRTRALRTTLW